MRKERAIDRTLLIIAFSALGSLALMTVFIFQAGLPLFAEVGLGDFVGGVSWRPSEGEFGILPMIIGSLCVTAGAMLLGIARALIKIDPETEATLRDGNFLTRDSREKERKKPGKKGARASFQFSKR